ncbi:hypothetical protein PV10_03120 [Exophiala mesophila]|uniref:Zn(2)-C6 fungal-type domain-containing protein n=1 Tax=Exophiala mesophila TaxID=212818 RepID=A0A0D1Y480_EXOME|nr:uncharacterized protein PV10_03120 [Exophiala mesophila]KIV95466.1 hypothetical protein PV10_03120 [Exophiala mesophila]
MSNVKEVRSKPFSCLRCFERKVKCDKQSPCSNCTRSKAECTFRIPPPSRRRKKKPAEEALLERLKQYEALLQSKGIHVDQLPVSGPSTSDEVSSMNNVPVPSPDCGLSGRVAPHLAEGSKSGVLFTEGGQSRFVENILWTSVSNEFRPKAALAEYSDDEGDSQSEAENGTDFLFGITPSSSNNQLQTFHPTHDNIFKLWQIFLDNINPMTKLIHQPSLHQSLVAAATRLDRVPKGLECLMFAIYTLAVFSISDEECTTQLGEGRKPLLARYRYATRMALSKARYMSTSDLQVLQAFLFYLISMREDYDSRTLWTLSGVASRIAQGMGLHRDGSSIGIPPFESELRRRAWWQLSILDFRSAELSGSGRFGDFGMSNVRIPANVDDADMWPGMTEAPTPKTRPGEMIACLLRCEFGNFWKEKLRQKSMLGIDELRLVAPGGMSLAERDANVDELERRLEDKFLRYCDPSVPLQFLAIIIARGAVASMRLMAHHPRKYAKAEDVPPHEQALLWRIAIHLLEADNLVHSSKQLKRFTWHSRSYFIWQALIYALHELASKTLGDEVDRAWELVDEVFLHHQEFTTYNRKPLLAAVGSLCLKAYAAREMALRQSSNGVLPTSTPDYILSLRKQRLSGPSLRTDTDQKDWELKVALEESNGKFIDALSDIRPPHYPGPQPSRRAGPEVSGLQANSSYQPQPLGPDNVMFAPDPVLMQDVVLDDGTMDWAQWDALMEDFGMGQNSVDPDQQLSAPNYDPLPTGPGRGF